MGGGGTDVNSILGRALWPRETPEMMMVVNGDILLAAATCPPAAVIKGLFKTLLRVRHVEFEAHAGVHNPNAWDAGAAEPGAPIDVARQLSRIEFGSACARWRHQWVDRITLKPWQEDLRKTLSHSKFGKKVRSWFEAWVNQYLGNRHVARAVIRYGCATAALLTSIRKAIAKEKVNNAKKRKRQDDVHGAGEPVS